MRINIASSRWNWVHASWMPLAGYFLSLATLGCILEWVSFHFGYKRYFISIEFLSAFLVAAAGWRWLGAIIFIAAIGWEAILGASSVLFFFNYSQIQTIARFVFEAKASYVLAFGGFLAIAGILYFGACRALRRVSWPQVFFASIGLVLLQAVISFREGNFIFPTIADRKSLLVGSSMYFSENIIEQNRKAFDLGRYDNVEYVPVRWPSALMQTLGSDSENKTSSRKILFIIAESWGSPGDRRVLNSQIKSIESSDNVRGMTLGSVHAIGATAFAEFRELCGKLPTKLNLKEISEAGLGECWPKMLARQGYRTVSVHGAHGTMYDRLHWYPVIGFQEKIFKENMPIITGEQCYSFPGYCDKNLFEVVGHKLAGNDEIFLYWLTLNSHMPYDRRDIFEYRMGLCEDVFGRGYSEGLCNYHNLHVQFFEGLAKLIRNSELSGTEVVVVGDHPPIFGDESSKSYFEINKVPFLHFWVK